MGGIMKILRWIAIAGLSLTLIPLAAQESDATASIPEESKEQDSATIVVQGNEISLSQAINYVIRENLVLRSAKYDVVMSDSDVKKYETMYSPTLNVSGGYTSAKVPNVGLAALSGDEITQVDLDASISKYFNTGTTVSVGLESQYYDANDPGYPPLIEQVPGYYQPNAYVMVQQELLKNAFGRSTQIQHEILKENSLMQKDELINQLSYLVVEALVDYWNVTIKKSAHENAQLAERSTQNVRNIIAGNVRYGLAQNYDINQYNALLAQARAQTTLSKAQEDEAVRKLLRTINMPPETEVEGVTNLIDTLPEMNEEEIVATALQKRVDYRNAKRYRELAELQKKKADYDSLPDLQAIVKLSAQGQDENGFTSLGQIPQVKYPTWYLGFSMSYPLWNKEAIINRRDANYQIKQAELNEERLKAEIRDDVINTIAQVRALHDVLEKTRTARREAEVYYNRIYRRIRQGNMSSVVIKAALDNMIQTRQQELEALVNYNVMLLRLDLAKNEIFERYDVDVEKILAEVK